MAHHAGAPYGIPRCDLSTFDDRRMWGDAPRAAESIEIQAKSCFSALAVFIVAPPFLAIAIAIDVASRSARSSRGRSACTWDVERRRILDEHDPRRPVATICKP